MRTPCGPQPPQVNTRCFRFGVIALLAGVAAGSGLVCLPEMSDSWGTAKQKCAIPFEDTKICDELASTRDSMCQRYSAQVCSAFREEHKDKCTDSWKLARGAEELLGSTVSTASVSAAHGGENAAQGKSTSQSSTGAGGSSSRAVDGNTATNWGTSSCTHTNTESNPWWRVDLGQEMTVQTVKVTNRGDCCGDRLSNFEVKVGNADSWDANTKCGDQYSVAQGQALDVSCSDIVGQYVFVVIPGSSKILTLCEVQVSAAAPGANCPAGKFSSSTDSTSCTDCPSGKDSLEGQSSCDLPSNCVYLDFSTKLVTQGNHIDSTTSLSSLLLWYSFNTRSQAHSGYSGKDVFKATSVRCHVVDSLLQDSTLAQAGDAFATKLPQCSFDFNQGCRNPSIDYQDGGSHPGHTDISCRDGAAVVRATFSFNNNDEEVNTLDASTTTSAVHRIVKGPCVTEVLAYGPQYSNTRGTFNMYNARCAVYVQSTRVGETDEFKRISMVHCVGQRQYRSESYAYNQPWSACEEFAKTACSSQV